MFKIKKFIPLLLALTFMSAAPVYAGDVTLSGAAYSDNTLIIGGSIASPSSDQYITLIVTPLYGGGYDLDNIVFLDQKKIGSSGDFEVSFSLELDEGYYIARIGGTDITAPRFIIIQQKNGDYSYTLGDVNGDGEITSKDSAIVLQYVLNKSSVNISPMGLYAANVSMLPQLDASSSAWILSKVLNGSIIFPAEKIIQKG